MTDEAIEITRNLILYYLERQKTVVLAMLDLYPMLLKLGGERILGIKIDPYIAAYEKMLEADTFSKPQIGIWKMLWKYRLHGIGCKLINVYTDEPLEWDAPNPNSFRFDWFWEHLVWRTQHENADPFVELYLNTPLTTYRESAQFLSQSGIVKTGADGISFLSDDASSNSPRMR